MGKVINRMLGWYNKAGTNIHQAIQLVLSERGQGISNHNMIQCCGQMRGVIEGLDECDARVGCRIFRAL